MSQQFMQSSFEPGSAVTGDHGQRVHPEQIAQTERLRQRTFEIGERAWCVVGNGLSNQTFVEGPEGLIVIDTGECIEEMRSALAEVRRFTSAPVAACIYSHFHYVGGTRALLEETAGDTLPIYGHAGIGDNLRRFGGEAAPRYARGLVHQFGLLLPAEGPDSLENVGLGLFFRNPEHAPYTRGYLPATTSFDQALTARIAGLEVVMTHAPSDADDSITIWFPELKLAVNNLLWPALFNVFAIRGEEYRDPRVVLQGLDELAALPCEHLIGAHGPPLKGAGEIRATITDYRDAIQFLMDQTVRGANKGLNVEQLTEFVQLPERFNGRFHTRQLYGLAEHHVRQIYAGLFGWFDEDASKLFPLPPAERARRLIEGFGGLGAVRDQTHAALEAEDYRWALELAGWLLQAGESTDVAGDADRGRMAAALRGVACSTTSANVRNWCLTRALELEGQIDLGRYRGHPLREQELLAAGPEAAVRILRVMLDPQRAAALQDSLVWEFDDGTRVGLTVRGGVAVPFDGTDPAPTIRLAVSDWARILSGKVSLRAAFSSRTIRIEGDESRVRRLLGVFDHPAFNGV